VSSFLTLAFLTGRAPRADEDGLPCGFDVLDVVGESFLVSLAIAASVRESFWNRMQRLDEASNDRKNSRNAEIRE
jgi:hypothetical protein